MNCGEAGAGRCGGGLGRCEIAEQARGGKEVRHYAVLARVFLVARLLRARLLVALLVMVKVTVP